MPVFGHKKNLCKWDRFFEFRPLKTPQAQNQWNLLLSNSHSSCYTGIVKFKQSNSCKLQLQHNSWGNPVVVLVWTSRWGFTRPSLIYFSVGIVRVIVPLVKWCNFTKRFKEMKLKTRDKRKCVAWFFDVVLMNGLFVTLT